MISVNQETGTSVPEKVGKGGAHYVSYQRREVEIFKVKVDTMVDTIFFKMLHLLLIIINIYDYIVVVFLF